MYAGGTTCDSSRFVIQYMPSRRLHTSVCGTYPPRRVVRATAVAGQRHVRLEEAVPDELQGPPIHVVCDEPELGAAKNERVPQRSAGHVLHDPVPPGRL